MTRERWSVQTCVGAERLIARVAVTLTDCVGLLRRRFPSMSPVVDPAPIASIR